MQRCTSCGVNLTGKRRACPLCGQKLDPDVAEESYDVFPKVSVKFTYDFIFKISTFVGILAILVINIINYVFIPHLAIYVPLSLGVVGAWIIINVGVIQRKNVAKNIMYEAVLSMLLCILWDKLTGWRGWSIDFVLPVTSASLAVFYFVMGIADRRRPTTYATYFTISMLGIGATLVLLYLDMFQGISRYFAVISAGVGLSLLVAQIIFRGKSFFSELYRWLHM
ncbi:MAG: DUF6320 domain-containing protein [Eubacteriales bacterium]